MCSAWMNSHVVSVDDCRYVITSLLSTGIRYARVGYIIRSSPRPSRTRPLGTPHPTDRGTWTRTPASFSCITHLELVTPTLRVLDGLENCLKAQ